MPPASSIDAKDAVVVSGLVKRYGRRGSAVEAVRGLDLAAPTGAVTAILGPNGAGKTTTVECCEGLRTPDAGTVRVLGLDPSRDAKALRPRVGVMLQDGGLPSTVPAGEVLRHVASMYAAPRDARGRQSRRDLGDPRAIGSRLGLDSFAKTQVRRLSGGQRQRLALAVALVGDPELVFLDEPSAGMDPQARLAVWDLVRELRSAGTTIILTTHQMAEAEALADHLVVVDEGRVLASGSTRQVVGDSGTVRLSVRPASPVPRPVPDDVLLAQLTRSVAAASRPGAPAAQVTAPEVGTFEVHACADPALLHAITGWAQDADLLVTSLTCGARTLEDVFLDLTGRHLR